MEDKGKQTPKQDPQQKGDASDQQLDKVAGGGGDRFRDEHGHYREGEWGGHHYHDGYRGRWENGIWITI
jgi:hypothetical protein